MPDPVTSAILPDAGQVTYGKLNQRHPERDCRYLERLWAFYKGGRHLLGNRELMDEVFPRHRREVEEVYNERMSRAFYIGICGSIVEFLTSTLMSDPIRVGQSSGEKVQLKLDAWYENWIKNVAPKGAPAVDLVQFMRGAALSMQVTKESWVRVDLPVAGTYTSRADQEKAGGLNAWLVQIPTGCVLDWYEDAAGALEWAIVHSREMPRAGLAAKRDHVVERWFWYDRTQRIEYAIRYKAGEKPKDEQAIPEVGRIPHKFGAVPLVRKQVPDALWAMDTLESIQREHFNKRNAQAWSEFHALLPELYEFLAPEAPAAGEVIGENQKDAERATAQPRGQGYVQERGNEDHAEFIGPPTAPFAEARLSCQELRDEMHRVLHLMALAVAPNASMLGRSAASKAQDQIATAIVAGELGRHLREHAVAIMEMVSRVRGDVALAEQWQAEGAAQFVTTSIDDVVSRATQVEAITIKSPTFRRLWQASTAETLLGDACTPDVKKAIEEELAKNITDEDIAPGNLQRVNIRGAKPGKEGEEEGDGDMEGMAKEMAGE